MLLNQQLVQQFVTQAIAFGDYEQEDNIYIQNQLLRILNAIGIDVDNESPLNQDATANAIAQYWIEQAVNENCLEDALYKKEIVEAQILDLITPRPSVINRNFVEAYKKSPETATNYFYEITKRNHYVKEDAIDLNLKKMQSKLRKLKLNQLNIILNVHYVLKMKATKVRLHKQLVRIIVLYD